MDGEKTLLKEQIADGSGADGQTRAAVVSLLVDEGPLTAGDIAERLGISPAGVRRHLDILEAAGDIETAAPGFGRGGRGRPAKWFQLSPAGRGKLRHAYDDLAGAALRKLRAIGGQDAVDDFARDRIDGIVEEVTPATGEADTVRTLHEIADALTGAGYSADVREAGTGVQICQHHCPVAHVAAEFPELCEAETARFTELLGTHVQRLATIANGDCVCTTHVPLHPPADGKRVPVPRAKEPPERPPAGPPRPPLSTSPAPDPHGKASR
ncbi:transcriptional regulator [Gordonia iterans]|uniref:Transcriptional regulator n=1 Tax=Gordonia iterans TaxID=1004901 RepID=A0A2S0KG52_9ACTN|nr:metalloregulator ArsR/SmtB family transcription factor [Gordonia iterans]AVM00643.1 transcriptional regulator [Gordonia iterans]